MLPDDLQYVAKVGESTTAEVSLVAIGVIYMGMVVALADSGICYEPSMTMDMELPRA